MNIAYDAAPLILKNKTGIAYCEEGIVSALMLKYPDHNYIPQTIKSRPVRIVNRILPMPYSMIFPQRVDVTHFFNYLVPPGVRSKVITTVHDLAYLVFPETVRYRTRKLLDLSLQKSIERADRIMAPSSFTKSEIVKYFEVDENKIFVAE